MQEAGKLNQANATPTARRWHLPVMAAALTLGSASAQAQGLFGDLPVGMAPTQIGHLDILKNNPLKALQDALQGLRIHPSLQGLAQIRENKFQLKDSFEYLGVQTSKISLSHKGVEVVGGEILRHVSPWGEEISAGVLPFDVSVNPRVTLEDAIQLGEGLKGLRKLSSAPELKLLALQDNESPRLTYKMTLSGDSQVGGATLWIDAQTGELIAEDLNRLDIAPIDVVEMSDACQEVDEHGYPVGFDPKLCKKTISAGVVSPTADASARRAASNASKVATYYLNTHNRNSFDGRGTGILNLVHIGKKFSNAFWDTQDQLMAYGDGDGEELGDFTLAVDVAGHEMTHGVVSATAKLQGFGEAGALNEAFADIFGKLIAKDGSWTIGKELFLDQTHPHGIRDLADPGSLKTHYRDPNTGVVSERPYPSKMSEMFPVRGPCQAGTNDKCWVHVNSTIPSHAAYLIMQDLGMQNAEKIFYLTLTQYLRPTSSFRTMARAMRTACGQLYGVSSDSCSKVGRALTSVGL